MPALILSQPLPAPIGDVKRRVGEDVIRFQIRMRVFMKTARAIPADIGVDAVNGKVHLGEPPGGVVDLLPKDRQVQRIAAVIFDKFL